MVPMRGQVMHAGKPLAEGEIRWIPVAAKGSMARGRIDEDGSFSLTTASRERGIAVGDYKIVVIAYGPEKKPKRDANGYVIESYERPLLVPKQYADPETTPLQESVDGSHSGYIEINLEE